jgi:hypothetical protein
MRNLINLIEDVSSKDLSSLKAVISKKIKELPADDATIKALREIEDLLRHVNAGGKYGIINNELKSIDDPSVTAAQKDLARYLMSMDMPPEYRDEMFSLWKADKLVNHKNLLSAGKKTFSDTINGYDTNPVIREFVNDVMKIAALGQGKGEFGLSVLSKSINKQVGKGDLSIKGRPIEVKTNDAGAARFTDQEVRPGAGFDTLANELNNIAKSVSDRVPPSGLTLPAAGKLLEILNLQDKKLYNKTVSLMGRVINVLFDNTQTTHVSEVMDGLKSGNIGQALQSYAIANYDFYMSKKEDEGVLYIDLTKEPTMTIFFKKAEELYDNGMRLHAKTAYITSTKDIRLPYPQMTIVSSSQGSGATSGTGGVSAKAAQPRSAAPSVVTGKRVDIRPKGAASPRKQAGNDLGRARR